MFKRNIFLSIISLVMLTSFFTFSLVQPSTIHAILNQEQTSEIKYVNKNLGFSLIIPVSWKDKYLIREDGNGVSFVFRYNNQTYEDIIFFNIGYGSAQGEGWEKELRGVRTLGRKGNMMYSSYTPFNISDYNKSIPDQATRDIALSMAEQIDAVIDSFQMIKSTGEPVNSGKSKDVIYTNDTHKFSLVLPEIWKEKYSIDEIVEVIGAHTTKIEFYFVKKTDGYREPIFMIYIYDEKLYNSNEEGEDSIPAHILGKGHGKIYEIVINSALQNYDRYGELFPNATKEEHKILATMIKQVKDITASFKLLKTEGAVAGEAKSIQEENKTQTARTPKEEGNSGEKAEEANADKYKSSIAGSSKSIVKWMALGNIIDPDLDKDRVRLALRNYRDFEAVADSYFLNSIKMLPGTILLSPASGKPLGVSGPTYQFGHAAIVGSDGTSVIEAPGFDEVVRTVSLHEWIQQNPFYIGYIVDGATEDQAYNAAKYAQKKADPSNPAPYIGDGNLFKLAGEALTGKYREDVFYCSSLVWRSWYNQGFDIDYNDKQVTLSRNKDTLVGNLITKTISKPIYEEDVETVFPAEIAQDLQVIPVTKSELLLGEVVETKKEEFYPYYYGAWLENNEEVEGFVKNKLDQRYLLNVLSNNSRKPIRILVKEADGPMFSKAKTLYRREVKPGEIINNEVMKVPMKFPEGTHKIFVKCISDQKEDCNAMVSIQSSKNWGLKSILKR